MSTEAMEAPGTVVDAAAASSSPVTRRKARVAVTRVDPWSVMKLAFVLSIALAIVSVVASALLWWVLDSAGVFTAVSEQIVDVAGDAFRLEEVLTFGRVMGFTVVVAVIDIVLITALATLTAFLFNLATGMVGGVELTLTEGS